MFNQRKQYKKGTVENGTMKLALNGVYGDSNNRYSPFYDPQYTMKITINGQLLLCKLAEMLMVIPSLKMIQINTDGLTVKLPRVELDRYRAICDQWQAMTKLELEFVEYEKMFIRDVNNYIAISTAGKVKRKGAYEYADLGWHQNQSALVIPKAVEAVLVKGYHLETFIKYHRDDFDFMLLEKATGGSKLMLNGVEQQKHLRFFASVDGYPLSILREPTGQIGAYKRKTGITDNYYNTIASQIEPGAWDERIHTKNKSTYQISEVALNKGYLMTECNHVSKFDRSKLNYQFYIDEARKLIDKVTK